MTHFQKHNFCFDYVSCLQKNIYYKNIYIYELYFVFTLFGKYFEKGEYTPKHIIYINLINTIYYQYHNSFNFDSEVYLYKTWDTKKYQMYMLGAKLKKKQNMDNDKNHVYVKSKR